MGSAFIHFSFLTYIVLVGPSYKLSHFCCHLLFEIGSRYLVQIGHKHGLLALSPWCWGYRAVDGAEVTLLQVHPLLKQPLPLVFIVFSRVRSENFAGRC